MASKDFIPHPNDNFDSWQQNFVTLAGGYLAGWNLSDAALAEWTLLTATPGKNKMRWDAIWAIVRTKNFLPSHGVEMRGARKEYENGNKTNALDTSLRLFISRYIRNNPAVKTVQKAKMGLTLPELSKSASPNTLKKEALFGYMRDPKHLIQVIGITIGSRKSKAKDKSVKDIQVFMTITEAKQEEPPDIKAFAYDGVMRRGLYKHVFTPDQVGMRAWYYVRFMFKGKMATYGVPSGMWSSVIM